ncbi:hypothetical protein LNW12_28635, partial [Klebsiella pneumoniae]|nr:hypothetical protein [Klebsiella pneumoniae]
SAQIREILINESAWEEMTCLFALSLVKLMISVKMICMMNILSVVQDLSLHLVTYVPQLCFFVSLLFFTCRREFQRISIVELAVRTA